MRIFPLLIAATALASVVGPALAGADFQSSKMSPGIVLQGASFQSSKVSVGIVVESTPGGGVIPRAPLTHW